VWDGSSQFGSEVTFSTWTAWDELEAEVEVPLESAGSGQWRTVKPVLAYEGELPEQLRSLLERDYLLLKASDLFIVDYDQDPGQNPPQAGQKVVQKFSLVAVGDSITAGVQDLDLYEGVQRDSYPNQLAQRNNLTFGLPLVRGPHGLKGTPRLLVRRGYKEGRAWTYYASFAALTLFRDNPRVVASNNEVRNFAVPGATITELLYQGQLTETPESNFSKGVLLNNRASQIDQAKKKDPSLVLFWAGNNDALRSVVAEPSYGIVSDDTLTPLSEFIDSYTKAIALLQALPSKPDVVVATIPDISVIPLLLPLGIPQNGDMPAVIKRIGTLPFSFWIQYFGFGGEHDVTAAFERLELSPIRQGGGANATHPAGTKVSFFSVIARTYELNATRANPVPPLTFTDDQVLSPGELTAISQRTRQFNDAIKNIARRAGIPVVDVNAFFSSVAEGVNWTGNPGDTIQRGYTIFKPPTVPGGILIGQYKLDTTLGGGLFSYDGIHPSRTGQAILANSFIDTINGQILLAPQLGSRPGFGGLIAQLQSISEFAVYEQDPRRRQL
jgi:lysophospholipase L1-like esterase